MIELVSKFKGYGFSISRKVIEELGIDINKVIEKSNEYYISLGDSCGDCHDYLIRDIKNIRITPSSDILEGIKDIDMFNTCLQVAGLKRYKLIKEGEEYFLIDCESEYPKYYEDKVMKWNNKEEVYALWGQWEDLDDHYPHSYSASLLTKVNSLAELFAVVRKFLSWEEI